MTVLAAEGFLEVAGQRLEYRFAGPQPDRSPTLVLLHEGLGGASLWGGFPRQLAQATGAGVFAYSRAGYGASSPVSLPRPLTYMQDEALERVKPLLDAIGFTQGMLIGHSDGASIAAVYAGGVFDPRVRGITLLAPHFFVEDMTVAEIEKARINYETTDLRAKLARWHTNVDCAFYGWNRAWLDPDFRAWNITDYLPSIQVPVQIIQGEDDQYGTIAQIESAERACSRLVKPVLLPNVRHSPHRDAPEATLRALANFYAEVFETCCLSGGIRP